MDYSLLGSTMTTGSSVHQPCNQLLSYEESIALANVTDPFEFFTTPLEISSASVVVPEDVDSPERLIDTFDIVDAQFGHQKLPSRMGADQKDKNAVRAAEYFTLASSTAPQQHHEKAYGRNVPMRGDTGQDHDERESVLVSLDSSFSSYSQCSTPSLSGGTPISMIVLSQGFKPPTRTDDPLTEGVIKVENVLGEEDRWSLDRGSSHSESSYSQGDEEGCTGQQSEVWEQKYKALLEFYQREGHCQVPSTSDDSAATPNCASLARWVKRQRYQFKRLQEGRPSCLNADRIAKLNELGFVWSHQSAAWYARLADLKGFRSQSGHCNVPSNYPPNQSLAMWCKAQRRQYRLRNEGNGNMSDERISVLNSIGFEFVIRPKAK